jgi:aldose 1-epimerase
VRLTLRSPDGDQGFPGALTVVVTYTLAGDGGLRIDYEATNDEPAGGSSTIVNLTNHAYFNLAGEGSGSVEEHVVQLLASRYTPVTEQMAPTGELAPVVGTAMDFREPTPLGARLREGFDQLRFAQGYDHNWVLDGPAGGEDSMPAAAEGTQERGRPEGLEGLALAAVVREPVSGRVLETWTDQPGLQFYSGNFLDATLAGKSGRVYRQGDAFTLETQHFPDSPNQPDFPSTVLAPGATFRTSTVWRFGTD